MLTRRSIAVLLITTLIPACGEEAAAPDAGADACVPGLSVSNVNVNTAPPVGTHEWRELRDMTVRAGEATTCIGGTSGTSTYAALFATESTGSATVERDIRVCEGVIDTFDTVLSAPALVAPGAAARGDAVFLDDCTILYRVYATSEDMVNLDVSVAATVITGEAPASNCPTARVTLYAGIAPVVVSDRADGAVVVPSEQDGPRVAGSGAEALMAWLVDTADGRRLFAAKLHPEDQGMMVVTTSPFVERLDGAFDGPAPYALAGVPGGALVATAEPAGGMFDVKLRHADFASLSFAPPVTIATVAVQPEIAFIRNAGVPTLYVLSGDEQSVAKLTPAGALDGTPIDLGRRIAESISDPVAFEDGYLLAARTPDGISLFHHVSAEPPMTVDIPIAENVAWSPAVAAIAPGHIFMAGLPLGEGIVFMDFDVSPACR